MIEVEYQRALFNVIDGAKASLGLVGVYDIAPQAGDGSDRSAYPYAIIGRTTFPEKDTQTKTGFQASTRLFVFSRTGSMLECKTIQGGIYNLLHRTPFPVTGFNHYSLLRNDTDCIPAQDNAVQGICEYVGLLESA